MEDLLILVDTQNRQIGVAGKLHAHQQGLLHRAISIFIFDHKRRLLLQQRADAKYHSPGLWTNACCGHPRLGETILDAAKRRLSEEMGMACELSQRFALIYNEPVPGGLTEYEYDHVLVGESAMDPIANPDEAKAWRWVHPEELYDELNNFPETFTVWFRTIVQRVGLSEMASWAAPVPQSPKTLPANRFRQKADPFHLPDWLEKAVYPLHPLANEAQQHTRKWLRNLGLEDSPETIRRLDIYIPGTFAGYMWSNVSSEILFIASDLLGWFCCQDNLTDEDCTDPESLERQLRGIYNHAFTPNTTSRQPLAVGLADIIRRAGRLMSPLWKQRVGEQYLAYLAPCLVTLMHRAQGTQPGVEGYESFWQNAGGFQVCLEFIYLAQNIQLPSAVYYSPAWQELRSLALNLLKSVNDLLSFRMMENPDEDIYNLVTHLRHTQGYSPEQAALEVSHRIDQWARRFMSAQTLLPGRLAASGYDERAQEQAMLCAQALHDQWRGNIAWHLMAPRYQSVRFAG